MSVMLSLWNTQKVFHFISRKWCLGPSHAELVICKHICRFVLQYRSTLALENVLKNQASAKVIY